MTLSHEKGVVAGRGEPARSAAVRMPLSATAVIRSGRRCDDPIEHTKVDRERPQVPAVHTDDSRSGVDGAVHLVDIVDLDERREAKPFGGGQQFDQFRIRQGADDQQCRIGAEPTASINWYSETMKSFRRIGVSTAARTARR